VGFSLSLYKDDLAGLYLYLHCHPNGTFCKHPSVPLSWVRLMAWTPFCLASKLVDGAVQADLTFHSARRDYRVLVTFTRNGYCGATPRFLVRGFTLFSDTHTDYASISPSDQRHRFVWSHMVTQRNTWQKWCAKLERSAVAPSACQLHLRFELKQTRTSYIPTVCDLDCSRNWLRRGE
jgi:hypothetical protein